MSTLFRKALRDLWGERTRSASIVLSLALGIVGFFAVLSAFAILTRALNQGYLATNPASATLHVAKLSADDVGRIAALPGIQAAEARRTVRGRIKSGPAQWKDLILFARASFSASRIGTIARQSGDWPASADELAIERDAMQVAHLHVGDLVQVRTAARPPRVLRVIGTVHDVGQAQARMENHVYGYLTLDALRALGEEPLFDQVAIRVAQKPWDADHIQRIAAVVAKDLALHGQPVSRTDVPTPGEHPHAKLMGLLMLSLAVFGFFILTLSGVLVFNVLTALLAGQLRQIGVMKAIGGSRFQIARVYLLEAGMLGLLAIALALPFGHLGSRLLCRALALFLNFDIESFAVPLWVYALVLLVGVAVPMLAALWPVWRATRISVREALSHSGTPSRVFGQSLIDRALLRQSGQSRVLLLALRNLSRQPLRVALTMGTLIAGGVFFMSALNLRQSLVHTVDRYYQSVRADLSVRLAADYPRALVEQVGRQIPGVAVVEGWTVAQGKIDGRSDDRARNKLTVIALPPRSGWVKFDVSTGSASLADSGSVIFNTALHDRMGRPRMGSEVQLHVDARDVALRITGVSREPFAPPVAYVARDFLQRTAQSDTVNSLGFVLADPSAAAVDALKAQVDVALERAGVSITQASTKRDSRYSFDQHMLMIYVFLIVVSCILASVGALGLLTSISLNVSERRRELGVLRAIGATPNRIAQIIVLEGLLLGVLAWLLAALSVVPLTKVIGDLILRRLLGSGAEIAFDWDGRGIGIWLLIAILGSVLASFLPARSAARMSVREALAYE